MGRLVMQMQFEAVVVEDQMGVVATRRHVPLLGERWARGQGEDERGENSLEGRDTHQ